MANIKIVATGLSGMAGSRIAEVLADKYHFVNFSLEEGVDILDKKSIYQKMKSEKPQYLLHLAAKTDVDACEKDKDLGEKSQAWRANVIGTENLVEICAEMKIMMIYISTDFVFDGRKKGAYQEDDLPNPINFYGQTKLMGEKIVQKELDRFLICRLSFLYGGNHPYKKDFVQRVIERLKNGQEVVSAEDEIFTPTFIPDIAVALDKLIEKNAIGIYHLVGSSSLSPYEGMIEIAKAFRYDSNLIKKTRGATYYQGRAARPDSLRISNRKLTDAIQYHMKTFEEGLRHL